jgi:hypothetical protein
VGKKAWWHELIGPYFGGEGMAQSELLESYDQASAWTLAKVTGAVDKMDCTTPNEGWDVRTLLNHMLDTQRYFTGAAQGEEASLPSPTPPDLISGDPIEVFKRSRSGLLHAFRHQA